MGTVNTWLTEKHNGKRSCDKLLLSERVSDIDSHWTSPTPKSHIVAVAQKRNNQLNFPFHVSNSSFFQINLSHLSKKSIVSFLHVCIFIPIWVEEKLHTRFTTFLSSIRVALITVTPRVNSNPKHISKSHFQIQTQKNSYYTTYIHP